MKNTFTGNSKRGVTRPGFIAQFVLTILLLTLLPSLGSGAENISAKYTRSNGNELVISIAITPPAPTSIILVLKLPPGVKITHAQPAAKNIKKKKGRAKWLLKEIAPGTRTIRISLDREVSEKDISATLRYKPSQGGRMITLPVRKQ